MSNVKVLLGFLVCLFAFVVVVFVFFWGGGGLFCCFIFVTQDGRPTRRYTTDYVEPCYSRGLNNELRRFCFPLIL